MKFKLLIALSLVFACEAISHATPITYSISTYASGSLGATSFTGQYVTLTYFGDTTGLGTFGGSIVNTGGVSGVNIAGLGSALLTDTTIFFITGTSQLAGIYDITNPDSVDSINAAFTTYAGDTSLGPLLGAYYTLPSYSFATTSGALVITSASSTGLFEAELASTVPEPTTLLLLGTGAVGVLSSIRKRLA